MLLILHHEVKFSGKKSTDTQTLIWYVVCCVAVHFSFTHLHVDPPLSASQNTANSACITDISLRESVLVGAYLVGEFYLETW